MASTTTELWGRVIDLENLYKAYSVARRGKRYRVEALRFSENLEENLITLQNELIWKQYKQLPLRQFYVSEPKKRLISAPDFRDRVVHHALVQIVEEYFEKRFVSMSFACRRGMGTHEAMKYVQKCCRAAKQNWGGYYVLKCDVSKYFPSINHDVLKQQIRKTISDVRILELWDGIIDSFSINGKGIPIGSLTSQLEANINLDPLDHFIKEVLRVKYYARYMDDFILLDKDKNRLKYLKHLLENMLISQYDLKMNPKTDIFPAKHGIDFCGYRIWPEYIKPRKSTMRRARKRFRKMASLYPSCPQIIEKAHSSIVSFLGYVKYCAAWRATKNLLQKTVFTGSELTKTHKGNKLYEIK